MFRSYTEESTIRPLQYSADPDKLQICRNITTCEGPVAAKLGGPIIKPLPG